MYKAGMMTQNFDTLYGVTASSGDNSTSYTYSAAYQIDTSLRQFSTITFRYQYSYTSDGGSCLGCDHNQSSKNFYIRLHSIPWTFTSDSSIVASISWNELVTLLDSARIAQNEYTYNPNFGHGIHSESIRTNLPLPNSSIKISLRR